MDDKATKGRYLETLLRSSQTIFSIKDVSLMWGEENAEKIKKILHAYTKSGKLVHVRRGFYAKDAHYNRFELATRINTPSYVSFETVLTREGVSFQYYGNIFIASYVNREIEIDGQKYTFVRMKDYVLSNTVGIDHAGGYAVATRERAFLDRVYVSKDYHFDNMANLNWEKVFEILPIYNNKRLEKKVKEWYEVYKADLIQV